MNTGTKFMSVAVAVMIFIGAAGMAYAGDNIPKTPIDNILTYRTGLGLSGNQVEKLVKFNGRIIDKMMQVRAQACIRKAKIDCLDTDWSDFQSLATIQTINEYYDCLAKCKQLELEAIMKARGVLTVQQMRNYSAMASVEAMMLKLDNALSAAY
jgi:hypothetical protein